MNIDTVMINEFGENMPQNAVNEITDVEYYFYINNLKLPEYKEVVDYLKSRGFTDESIQKYKIGAGTQSFTSELGNNVDVKVAYFPMFQLVSKPKASESDSKKEDLK